MDAQWTRDKGFCPRSPPSFILTSTRNQCYHPRKGAAYGNLVRLSLHTYSELGSRGRQFLLSSDLTLFQKRGKNVPCFYAFKYSRISTTNECGYRLCQALGRTRRAGMIWKGWYKNAEGKAAVRESSKMRLEKVVVPHHPRPYETCFEVYFKNIKRCQ